MDATLPTLRPYRLADRYDGESGTVLLTGVQALVRLPFDQVRSDRRQGRRTGVFISGYEGSPLGGYDQALLRERDRCLADDVVVRPALNEEIAATAVWGSQQHRLGDLDRHDGIVGIWYGKAPGVDRAADAFKHANLMGVDPNGGVVVLAGDDPGSKSSTLPCYSEGTLADANIPVLVPGSPQDALDLGLHAIALSRASGLWTSLKVVTDVADGFADVDVDPARLRIDPPVLEVGGLAWRHRQGGLAMPPQNLDDEHELFYRRLAAAQAYAATNKLDVIERPSPRARIGIIATGKTYRDVRTVLDRLHVPEGSVRLLRIGMLWPLEGAIVRAFAKGLTEIVVVEEKRSFLELQVRDSLYDLAERPRVVGKRAPDGSPLVPGDGELNPTRLLEPLLSRLTELAVATPEAVAPSPAGRRSIPVVAARTPFFCSGCPHNRSTLVPEGSVVGGGIGCHTMTVYLEERNTVSVTQMGGEGAQWIGRSPFSATSHIFQNVGDGTFFHSGNQSLRACVAAGVNITYKILYNGTVAMTGGQDAVGALPVPALTRMLESEGVVRTIVCAEDPDAYPGDAAWAGNATVWPRDRLEEAQLLLRDVAGVTVLIFDQACAAERRRKWSRGTLPARTRRVLINERVCEGCGDCVRKSNCLSVEPVDTEFGVKRRIHESSCNQDETCLDGDCPSFVTYERASDSAGIRRPPRTLSLGELPEPAVLDTDGPVTIVLAGIGGTGVVTVSQVLATAALLEGRHVAGLDQTGLSQKAGAVVSHVRIGREASPGAAAASGEADILVAFDPAVGADDRVVGRARPGAHLVASTDVSPTGAMVRAGQPGEGDAILLRGLAAAIAPATISTVPASRLAERLFGSHLVANVIVLGAAAQAGVLPVTPRAVEAALTLNGRNVEQSLQAFRWGRLAVLDPPAVGAALADDTDVATPLPLPAHLATMLASIGATGECERLLRARLPELTAFQDQRLAQRYADVVAAAVAAETRVSGAADRLAPAVARHLFDLLAYKDEYEVARLHLDTAFRARLAGASNVRIQLHPPFLRALGWKRKIGFGDRTLPALKVLRSMRRLRGTPLDVFGRSVLRREERAVIEEYIAAVQTNVVALESVGVDHAVAVAETAALVRGYEEIKLASIGQFRVRLRQLGA